MINWERAMLGTALADPAQMAHAEDVLPSDLTGSHQFLWAEMISLHRRGSLGPRALVEALRASNSLGTIAFEDVDERGEAYIVSLTRYRGEEMPEYAAQVVAAATKRQLRDAAALIRSEAQDDRVSVEEALENAERRIISLRRGGRDGVSVADLSVAFSQRLQTVRDGTFVPAWTPKLEPVRQVIDFAEAEDFIIVAGRPGDGKSTYLRYELGWAAVEDNVPTLLINMENSELEIYRSLISMLSGIHKSKLKSGRLTEHERERVACEVDALGRVPLYIWSRGAPSAREIVSVCRNYISRHNVRLIGVDYIQLIANGESNKVQDVSTSAVQLRSVPLNFHVPLIAAAQMSRAIEQRGDNAEPQLSDLRESGALEQSATVVMFTRPVWANPTEQDLYQFEENRTFDENHRPIVVSNAVPMRFKIAKNRNGSVGTTKDVLFLKHLNSYRPVEENE